MLFSNFAVYNCQYKVPVGVETAYQSPILNLAVIHVSDDVEALIAVVLGMEVRSAECGFGEGCGFVGS
jgi:hypothetical protein